MIRIKSTAGNLKNRIATWNNPHLIIIQEIAIIKNCIPVVICNYGKLSLFIIHLGSNRLNTRI